MRAEDAMPHGIEDGVPPENACGDRTGTNDPCRGERSVVPVL
jgi:hypothetical protein